MRERLADVRQLGRRRAAHARGSRRARGRSSACTAARRTAASSTTHCAPPAAKYSVLGLGGSKEKLFELMHAGYRDLRDVPEAELAERHAAAHLAAVAARASRTSAPSCATLARVARLSRATTSTSKPSAPAVPIFAGTRPFETLPFQWSCHIETSRGARGARGISGPRRRAADAPARRGLARDARHERARSSSTRRTSGACIDELAARYPDLAAPLAALDRAHRRPAPADAAALLPPRHAGVVVDQGRAADGGAGAALSTRSARCRNGLAAQTAYFEAIEPRTSGRPPRRAAQGAARLLPPGHARARAARGVLRRRRLDSGR